MDMFAVLTPVIVIGFLAFLTVRLIIKYCKPSTSSAVVVASADTETPDFARVANHLFVSNTPHTYSQIYVDESSNVRSVTITRISPPGQHIVGYVLDPNSLLPIHHHRQQPPTYEDSIKSHSPPKYDMTPATTNSTTFNSMDLPTSEATTARVDGRRSDMSRGIPPLLSVRSMSDSFLGSFERSGELDGRKSVR